MYELGFIVLAVLAVTGLLALSGINIANEYQRAVILRLGRLVALRGPGLYYVIPFIERQVVIDQRVVTADVEEQEAITKDNVPVRVNAIPTSGYPTPAVRPANSRLDCSLIEKTYGVRLPTWPDALERCLDAIALHKPG